MSETLDGEAPPAPGPSWDRDLPRALAPPLQPGDPAPYFIARASNNPRFNFSSAGGRYLVLCFHGSLAVERSRRIVDLIVSRHRAQFDDYFAAFFGVSVDPADESQGRARSSLPGVRYFWDFDRAITRLYAGGEGVADPQQASEAGFTLILDPFLRVLANIPFTDPEEHLRAFASVMDTLPPPGRHAGVETPAPVLILPRVFEPEFCRALIDLYEAHGGGDSGFMRQEGDMTVAVLDHSFKRRSDVSMDAGPEFERYRRAIRMRVTRRILPQIKKAFEYSATRIERYLVACYDGETGGFFRAHRDNTTSGTAHRRFAVTINLNAEEYEGGDLRFPEFGDRTYRAPTGGAVVFSCGLLHEATPVTRGRRYACLPFLYDEAAAAIRDRNRGMISEDVVDQNKLRQREATGVPVAQAP